jgi:CBS domain-containing protein
VTTWVRHRDDKDKEASHMKVQDLMTTPVVSVGPQAPFGEIVETLLSHDVSGVPVVDDAGAVLGIVTEADLIAKEAYGYRRRRGIVLLSDYLKGRDPAWVRKAGGLTARELMTAAVATAEPEEEVGAAARRMLEGHHKRLPVVDDGKLVGILTRHDLLQPFYRPDEDIMADITDLLDDPLRMPETNDARLCVEGGDVTLDGDVEWLADVHLIESVVSRVPGVVDIQNRLHAVEPDLD